MSTETEMNYSEVPIGAALTNAHLIPKLPDMPSVWMSKTSRSLGGKHSLQ